MGKGPALSDGPFHQALASGGADRSGIGGGTTRRLEAVFQELKCDSVENRGRQPTAIEARTRIAVRGAPRSTRCEERHLRNRKGGKTGSQCGCGKTGSPVGTRSAAIVAERKGAGHPCIFAASNSQRGLGLGQKKTAECGVGGLLSARWGGMGVAERGGAKARR